MAPPVHLAHWAPAVAEPGPGGAGLPTDTTGTGNHAHLAGAIPPIRRLQQTPSIALRPIWAPNGATDAATPGLDSIRPDGMMRPRERPPMEHRESRLSRRQLRGRIRGR